MNICTLATKKNPPDFSDGPIKVNFSQPQKKFSNAYPCASSRGSLCTGPRGWSNRAAFPCRPRQGQCGGPRCLELFCRLHRSLRRVGAVSCTSLRAYSIGGHRHALCPPLVADTRSTSVRRTDGLQGISASYVAPLVNGA